jgi:uroporphyrinogen-III decarboxylase
MLVYTHTCGFIGDRLELMASTGIDGIECMDPPPLGDTELSDAKKRVGKQMFLKGNMDSVNVLMNAAPEILEEYVKNMIRDGAEDGGYILSTACSTAPGVKPEILKMLVPLAEKYGRY